MIVGNIGPDTFGSDTNQLIVIDDSGSKKIAQAEKLHLARQLIQLVAKKI
jgi:phosphopantothenoylcysteine decarboxylase/phosphopantothenate--cysteine ligase